MNRSKKRNLSLDLIKVVAMFMVMTLHVPKAVRPDYLLSAGGCIAGIAIPLFFMVSGYLLIGKEINLIYSIRKIIAILKFVILITLAYFSIECFIHQDFYWGGLFSAIINPFFQKGIFGVFWYLGAMIILYLILPIVNYLLINVSKYSLYYCLGFLFIIESFIFSLNLIMNLEYIGVIQTFRVWNWLFYFILGGIIHNYNGKTMQISTWLPITFSFVYIGYGYLTIPYVHAVEYLFSSPLCMIYAFIVFVFFIRLNIKSKVIRHCIAFLSNLFLPVYALHMIVIVLILKRIPADWFGIMRPIVFLLTTYLLTIFLSWVIMKIPGIKKIFKI